MIFNKNYFIACISQDDYDVKWLDLRNKTGVNVIRILRDTGNVNNPRATESFKPGDRVVVNGSVGDIELFKIFVAPAQETV